MHRYDPCFLLYGWIKLELLIIDEDVKILLVFLVLMTHSTLFYTWMVTTYSQLFTHACKLLEKNYNFFCCCWCVVFNVVKVVEINIVWFAEVTQCAQWLKYLNYLQNWILDLCTFLDMMCFEKVLYLLSEYNTV